MEDEELMKEIEEDIGKDEQEVFQKEINQVGKVEPNVKALSDMGTFYKEITKKLTTDKICYISKKPIADDEPFDIIRVPDDKVDKGMVAFVSVSKKVNI